MREQGGASWCPLWCRERGRQQWGQFGGTFIYMFEFSFHTWAALRHMQQRYTQALPIVSQCVMRKGQHKGLAATVTREPAYSFTPEG